MGVGTFRILFWLCAAGFVLWAWGMACHRLGVLYGRTGVGLMARTTKDPDVLNCRVCGGQYLVKDRHVETETCGHLGCVKAVMTGRARMAESRRTTEVVLRPKVIPAQRDDGSLMFTTDGRQVMSRHPSGEWERVHVPGGALTDRDRAALAWRPDGEAS